MKTLLIAALVLLSVVSSQAQFTCQITTPEDGDKIPGSLIRIVVQTTAPAPSTTGYHATISVDGVQLVEWFIFDDDAAIYCDYKTRQKGPHVIHAQFWNEDYSITVTDTITVFR